MTNATTIALSASITRAFKNCMGGKTYEMSNGSALSVLNRNAWLHFANGGVAPLTRKQAAAQLRNAR